MQDRHVTYSEIKASLDIEPLENRETVNSEFVCRPFVCHQSLKKQERTTDNAESLFIMTLLAVTVPSTGDFRGVTSALPASWVGTTPDREMTSLMKREPPELSLDERHTLDTVNGKSYQSYTVHEAYSGRTSAVNIVIMVFSASGRMIKLIGKNKINVCSTSYHNRNQEEWATSAQNKTEMEKAADELYQLPETDTENSTPSEEK
ncbi:hypothetical protein EVAR_48169_1 [Eumeta japonica]|uniref:Uncharacterized protein n=1 Tax=Eumeta variegata TaxID=151549 RepID=A0A4C1WTG1_EUMVA|nr:hypothetical protein EVAR_48169_1 [Eumeta japonica]